MYKKRLILIGSGHPAFRRYAVEAMQRRADLILFSSDEPTWQRPYLAESHVVDITDVPAMHEVAQRVGADGVITFDELLVVTAADLAQALDLPHTDPAAIRRCKDKHALRTALEASGLNAMRYSLAHDLAQAAQVAAEFGFPVVFKPLALGGSIGVVKVDSEADVPRAFELASQAVSGDGRRSSVAGVLIEEYLDGPEYSVDCVTFDGVTTPLFIAEKALGFAPYFEEVGHVVPAAPAPGLDEAVELVVAAHKALGLDRLVTHSEVRLTTAGPRIVEVNGRLGGGLIPYLGLLATGIDLAAAAADVATGHAPDLTATKAAIASITMLYPEESCRVGNVTLRRPISSYAGLTDFCTFLAPGSEVLLPPEGYMSRVGYAVVTAEDRDEWARRAAAVEADVVIESRPLVAR